MKKRVLALLICACMLIGMVPVFANEIAESGSTSSSSVEGTTSAETETGSTEGTGDASEPPVDTGDTSEPPVDPGDASEPPVDNGDTSEPPVDNGDTSEPPVDNGDTSEPPVDNSDTSEPPLDPEHPIVAPSENLLPSIPEFPNPFPPVTLECTCGAGNDAPGEEHAEDCPLYVEPEFDAEALYEELMSAETLEETDSITAEFSDEQRELFFDSLTAEQEKALKAHIDALYEIYLEQFTVVEEEPAVNFDDVAPFEQANKSMSQNRLMALMAPMGAVEDPGAGDEESPLADDDNNGLELSKTVTKTDDGYQIQLEAYTTGKITVSEGVKPCDIILVLDRSTSMDNQFSSNSYVEVYELKHGDTYYVQNGRKYPSVTWCSTCNAWTSGCWHSDYYKKDGTKYAPKTSAEDTNGVQFYEQRVAMDRMDALHQAATQFVNSVAAQGGDNRIAVLSFGQNSYRHTGSSDATALLDVATNQQKIINAIKDVKADEGATEHGKGLQLAKDVFNVNNSTDRQRVVIMITDGEPAPKGTNDWSSRVVQQAIDNAYALKNDYASAVYCISVMPGTDASHPTSNMDKFMSYVSSNYPNAQYTGKKLDNVNNNGNSYYSGGAYNIIAQITPGVQADLSDGSFYLTANDIDTLENIFEQIANQTGGSNISLGSETQIRDVVTQYFDMPTSANEVRVESFDCTSYNEGTGAATWAETGTPINNAVSIDPETETVTVTKFDFDRNFVAAIGRAEGDTTKPGDFHGRKIRITFTVIPKDGFWGGNGVPTNGEDSGVYKSDGTVVENFEVPYVDVPIKEPTLESTVSNIYFGGVKPSVDDLNKFQVPAEDWTTAFVTFTKTSVNVSEVSNTQDNSHVISVTVRPTEKKGTATAQIVTATAKVNVFEPYATFHNSTIYLGKLPNYAQENAPDLQEHPELLVWKHGDNVATSTNMIGNAPAVSYTYDPSESEFTGCTEVKPQPQVNKQNCGSANEFTVHILKPTITWADTSLYYGETIPTTGYTPVGNISWADAVHRIDESDAAESRKPADGYISYAFNVDGGKTVMPNTDVSMNVTTSIGSLNLDNQNLVTYVWNKCSADETKPDGAEFLIHPKFCELTIQKNVTGETVDENQSFIFHVARTEGNRVDEKIETTVTVQGTGSVTVKGLPIGTYKVHEEGGWSWRYEATKDGTATLASTENSDQQTITIENTLKNSYWLDGNAFAVNNWASGEKTVSTNAKKKSK